MKNYCCQYFHTTKVILQLNRDQSITHSFSSTCSRRQSLEISGTGFLQAKCLYCHLTISVKVLTKQPTHLTAFFPGLPRSAGTRKVNPIWILLKQETVSGSGINWAICKSALCSRQTAKPAPYHSYVFTGRMPFQLPNQQHQSTEGKVLNRMCKRVRSRCSEL